MVDVSEQNFEATIEQALLERGYHARRPQDYDKDLCLIPDDFFDFIFATQPEEWQIYQDQHGEAAKRRLLRRLGQQIDRRGTVEVLRRGLRDTGCRFQVAYFVPATGLNPELQRQYEANRFAVVRQLRYSQQDTGKSLDLAIFLNGLPIFTAELKNPLAGQTVENAIWQYRHQRDPRGEPLFDFERVLAHFAVDPDLVYFATHLRGPETRFFPFNRGYGTGAGNPPSVNRFATAYLWEEMWVPDSVLNLVQHFVHSIVEEDDEGRKEHRLIFPRYHQVDSVRRLISDAREHGAGERYLIQHSAGSGKSFSIAWLAHQLAGLHNAQDERIFDSIIVVTDRRVLDQQIQETVRQFEQTLGLVQPIERDSQQLKRALETGKQIIVSTLQKFPFIVDEVGRLPGRKFGVIIDEAHSSQSGETAKSLKQVLAVDSLEQAEETERDVEDMEDRIAREMAVRGRLPNVSFFAYTATPKGKTLELFGTPQPDGSYAPFSLYPMRQAIEEGFILDVLENYTTYASYFRLLKTVEDDPRFDKAQAAAMLKSFVDLHEHTIRRKVEIMVAHFARHVQHRIDGQAKAMIVTRSRLHCVRFKLEVDRYLRERGYDFKALVAFSGTVTDGGKDYTERSINGFPDSRTAHQFKKKPEYRIIVVADKFQTGFDVPLLHTMYVDKKLGGVNAVQTLSRLNRTHPGKEETMVLDFANEAEEIERAFAPYYEKTLLSEGTDPNQLYDLQDQLLDYHIFDLADVQRFAEAYFDPAGTQDQLHAALGPAVERFKAATKEEQADFRSKLKDYVRRYAFLSQVISFVDTDLEKFYQFARFLARKLPISRERLPVEIKQAVDIDSFRLQQTSSGPIKLPRGEGELQPLYETPGGYHTKDEEPLSQIIRELNERFGADFADEDKVRVVVGQLDSSLAKNEALKRSVEVNPPEKARLSFEHFVGDEMQKMIDIHFKFYKKFTDDPDFAQYFLGWLFDRYHRTVLAQNA